MRNPTLLPVVINPFRVTFTDNLMQTSNTYYFHSLEEVNEVTAHIDLERNSVTIRKVLFGDEYISEWNDPKQGQYYKMAMVRRDAVCYSKSFFLCKNPHLPALWYMALIYVQPKGISVEIRAIDPSGTLVKGEPIISSTLPAMKKHLNDVARNHLLDWYITRFVALHSPEEIDMEWIMKSNAEQQAELDETNRAFDEDADVFNDTPKLACQDCQH